MEEGWMEMDPWTGNWNGDEWKEWGMEWNGGMELNLWKLLNDFKRRVLANIIIKFTYPKGLFFVFDNQFAGKSFVLNSTAVKSF